MKKNCIYVCKRAQRNFNLRFTKSLVVQQFSDKNIFVKRIIMKHEHFNCRQVCEEIYIYLYLKYAAGFHIMACFERDLFTEVSNLETGHHSNKRF